jgi:hypothetical protein
MPIPFRPALPWIACALVLCDCAGGRSNGSRRGGPAGSDYAGKTLAVLLPDSGSVIVKDFPILAAALLEDFPGPDSEAPGAVLAREFDNAFWSGFSSAVDYVTPVRVPDSVPPAPEGRSVGLTVQEKYGRPSHTYSAPDSAWLAEHGVKADLILVVGPLAATHQQEEMHAYQFGGTIKINRLYLHGWYLIWDYSKGRAIAQGRISTKQEFRTRLAAKDWEKAFDQVMESVGDASPFRGQKWYHR